MNRDYILNYVNSLNEALDADISVTVEEAVLQRYALYGHCIGKALCWSELFEVLDDYHKKLHIIHAYAMIMDAVISRRGAVNKDMETVQLLIEPNKVAKVICKLMKVDFLCFEELQKEVYSIKAKAFPFPNPKGTYFKTNDEIRSGITKFKISGFYMENGTVMVKAQSINHFDGGARTITLPEIEMMQYYRIVNPAEFQADE